jgi:hypothetical protein
MKIKINEQINIKIKIRYNFELNKKIKSLNHFMKKNDRGGILAILNIKNKQIILKFNE